ncbi:FAD-binding domain-containing protein [Chryseolinea lacunae]|nr:FAD-binding domain-containing protein [Chryseolinea lacunae]
MERIDEIDPIQYGKTRNYTHGAVTYLSPYISRGVISVRQVQEAILAKGFLPGEIEKFLQELAWREYFQRVWQSKGAAIFEDVKQPQTNVVHRQMIDAIANATTGIDAIDNSIQEFYKTGYLHNHVRMYIASIACNIGQAHWLMPSRWMYAHLLDGDLASNMLSWQWVAGAFANKKYYCNQENINRYTNHYQQNTFLDRATETLAFGFSPPELKSIFRWELGTRLPSIPKPRIDVSKPTLLYNSYNLDPLWRKSEDVNRILLLEPSHFQKYPVSEKVVDFILSLSKNIKGLQWMIGEIADLQAFYQDSIARESVFVSKEHPAFTHYPGVKDNREWLYPQVTGYYPSFSSFWKLCNSKAKNWPDDLS